MYISSPTWGKHQALTISPPYFSSVLIVNCFNPGLFILYVPDALAFAGNHKNIFNDAGVPWKEYRYFDPKTVGLDFEGMMKDIEV